MELTKKSTPLHARSWLFILFMLFGSLLLFMSVEVELPDSVIPINLGTSTAIKELLPQGWAFFTKDPLSPVLIIKAANAKTIPVKWPIGSNGTLGGFNRIGRAQGIQFGAVNNFLPSVRKWQNTSSTTPEKLKYYTRPDLSSHPLLHGKYIIEYRKFNDWGLSTPNTITRPYKEIGVDIK